ncbi:HWE histidine kinase domain-containing protein [Chthonobacter rhizosphaerae]|uniref:HWE histidine kinase domain-containing protein n=1 Tax=Chthonobacter rhizosphaerae TaxID=2735553 RepID=UPI0015EECEAD
MTLSQRLFTFALLALLPVFAVVWLLEQELRQARHQEVRDLVARQTQQANSEMVRLTEGIRTLLTAVAASPSVVAFEREPCSAYVASLTRSLPHLRSILVLDLDGDVRCVDNARRPAANYRDRLYFTQALADDAFVTGVYTVGRTSGTAGLPMAQPLRGPDGRAIGVVAAVLNLGHIQGIVDAWAVPPNGSLTIADRNGVILARNPLPERFVGTAIPETFVTRWVRAAEPGVDEVTSQDGTRRVIAYNPATREPRGIYVSSGMARAEAYAVVDRNWVWNLAVLAAGVVGALATSVLAARVLIRRPVDDLVALAKAWAKGEPSSVPRPIATPEFETIALALDAMGQGIEERTSEAARHQELLVSELNHRVKNTLALVQAIGTQTAASVQDPAEFNVRFGERLRSLARTHDVLTRRNWSGVSLRELIEAEIAVTPAADRVTIEGPDIKLPPQLAVSISLIVHELATNAVKHGCLGRTGGELAVRWSRRDDPGAGTLDLSWSERCPTPVPPPTRTGFGSKLIQRTANSIGSAKSTFADTGLAFHLEVPLDGWLKQAA